MDRPSRSVSAVPAMSDGGDSAIMLMSAGRTLKKDALPITCGASLTRPPRLVFALSEVAHVLEIAAARALRAKRRPVQVVADVPGTVALE
jgi:hypothetical protein